MIGFEGVFQNRTFFNFLNFFNFWTFFNLLNNEKTKQISISYDKLSAVTYHNLSNVVISYDRFEPKFKKVLKPPETYHNM